MGKHCLSCNVELGWKEKSGGGLKGPKKLKFIMGGIIIGIIVIAVVIYAVSMNQGMEIP